MIAAAQACLGKTATIVSHKINDMPWAEFHAMVVQAVQPAIGTVATLKKMKEVKFNGDLQNTQGQIRYLTLEADPQAPPEEVEHHTFTALLNLVY